MPYSLNPHLPRVRMQAVLLVRQGWSIRKVARYLGFHHTAVMRWVRKASADGRAVIPTQSSRPHTHPRALHRRTVAAIIRQRTKHKRCAEVVQEELRLRGVRVSLSSVKRTLDREGLLKKRSPWKRYHPHVERPLAAHAGDLVQLDTVHVVPLIGERFYLYTLIDVASRWAYAKVSIRINTHASVRFVREAQSRAPFQFQMIQSDHGSEFSTWFTEHVNTNHRHSRVRQCNDNAHVERFNRTIQDECLRRLPEQPGAYEKAVRQYLPYYNKERLHLGLNLKTPLQVVRRY